jgi:hypothetical protein
MSRRRLAIAIPYLALTWLFGGMYGLLAGLVIVALWVSLGPFARVLWALSVLLLVAAPIAILAQGLPTGPTVGADFGANHMVAHVLVGLALATAGLAAFAEAVGGRKGSTEQPGKLPDDSVEQGQHDLDVSADGSHSS